MLEINESPKGGGPNREFTVIIKTRKIYQEKYSCEHALFLKP